MANNKPFQFEISLSVLNHLGRNLYRNFITVLGEAISNSWDADACNVWIYIDRENGNFIIKDDGDGMSRDDFQKKFLTVGYTKRKGGKMISPKGRPYIGAKGIGKLALLSCAKKISIITKTSKTNYINGAIDNTGLDKAIKRDLKPDQYSLENADLKLFESLTENHKQGTIIYFEQSYEDIKNRIPFLKKLIALYFRFSLLDNRFNLYVNDEKVTLDDIKELSDNTEFLFNINGLQDPFFKTLKNLEAKPVEVNRNINIGGFIASVIKPRFLKITGTDEKVGIDLFVNGRLREKNILKHLPDFSTRHVASYLYGQIHYDKLDSDGIDRFNTSRESITSGEPMFEELLKIFKEDILEFITDKWDELRLERGKDGEDENPRKTLIERRARSLYNLSSEDYTDQSSEEIKDWVKQLRVEAEFNIPAYVNCFLSENLIRRFIDEKSVPLTTRANNEIKEWKEREEKNKSNANINFNISRSGDLSFLCMDTLADTIDGAVKQNKASLARDAIEYKPMRNAVGHTALLTDNAKERLIMVYENIKARIKKLLS